MEKVRLGVIGFGNIGCAHAHSIYSGLVKGLELAAICDIDPCRIAQAEKVYPDVKLFTDFHDLLSSGLADAVLIATPHYLHPHIAVKAFEKGLHVLTEKPAGVFTRQVKEMNDAAIDSGRVFGIMFNQRTNPLFQKARVLVQSGRLGQPKRFLWIITNWYRTQSYYDSGSWRATWAGEGGGVLINQAPHNLDLWQWIFGMPQRLRATCYTGKYHNIEVEDEASIYAEYENGATAMFLTSTGEFPGTNRLEISGDRGKIVIADGKLQFWELEESERSFCFADKTGTAVPTFDFREFESNQPETAHVGILQNFTDAILHGAELLAPGYEGINSLQISNAAYLSSWTDSWVDLPVDEDMFCSELDKRIKSSKLKGNSSCRPVQSCEYYSRWNIKW